MATQESVARCAFCGDELRSLRDVEVRYRLERVDPVDRLGELCPDCGDGLFEREATDGACLECDRPATRRLTRLVATEGSGSMWQGSPDTSMPLFCDDHVPEPPAPGSGGSDEENASSGPAHG